MGLPERVLHDAEVIGAIVSLPVVKRKADAVGSGAVCEAHIYFFLSNLFLQVPHVNFVGCRVH